MLLYKPSTIPASPYGGFGEGLGIVVTFALLLMTPSGSSAFPWTLAGFIALLAMHAAYWILTHPVNKFWLKDQELKGFAAGLFAFDPLKRDVAEKQNGDAAWKYARNRWEYSHVLRAILAVIALIALIVAVAI